MKKILLLLSLLVAFFVSNAQYPVVQFLGRDSALVDSRGGLKARLINYAFTDTTEANTQRINQYPGAMIYTTTGDKLWLRNSIASLWVEVGTGGGGGGGISAVGAINGASKSVNGSVISGATIYFQIVDGTYPGLMTPAQKARLDSNSYLTIDKRYDSIAWRRNDSTFLTKSLRIQANGITVTPTTTDSSLSYNITGVSTDTTSLSTRINSKLDTARALSVDTTNAVTGYEAYLDRTGGDTLKFRSATGGSDSLWVIDFQPSITTNAPAVGDSLLYHSYFPSKIRWVYREQKLLPIDDSVGYTINYVDTQIIFHPPLATNERIHIELKDSVNYKSLPLQVKSSSALLLDTYPSATGAYSLRKLRTAYAGSCIKVRRSSDNNTQDIGFLASGYLDTASMKTFVSTGTGYIDTWYDQSGNAYDLTQSTQANQPVIIESGGTVYRQSGQVAIKFTAASSQWMSNSSLAASSAADAYLMQVFKSNAANVGYAPVAMASNALTYQHGSTANKMNAYAGNIYAEAADASTVNHITELVYDGGGATNADKLKYYTNGSAASISSYSGTVPTTISGTGIAIGRFYAVAAGYLDGSVSELIVWMNDKSASRSSIESNVNTFYSIH